MKQKKLEEQTIVITGASSGIGLVTARKAAAKGAKLVLAARSENALRSLVEEFGEKGYEAIYVVADVKRREDVAGISAAAERQFGGFDTWINNAGVSIFGKMEDTPIEDMRELFETNFWGVVYGSLEAIKVLKERGGSLINLGSVVSDQVAHLQGMYSATKHAVKGFTDALRMEMEEIEAPISVTLIKPAAMDTPFTLNAKNFTGREFRLPPPVYSPDLVAESILHAAENPRRDIMVGGGARGMALSGLLASRLTDKVMESEAFTEVQKKDRPASPEENALDKPSERLQERGNYDGYVLKSSLTTKASLHPVISTLAVVTLGLGLAALLDSFKLGEERHEAALYGEEQG